jgi:malonyl-CoA O-methyltransferase
MSQSKQLSNKNTIANSFSKAAHHYDKYAFVQKNIAERLQSQIFTACENPQTILDLGSGTGKLSNAISCHYPNATLTGIDLAKKMNLFAQQKRVKNNQFICADAESLPFANNSIDIIYSNCTIQWCENLYQLFSECSRVLKPEGKLFFTTFGPSTLNELRDAWQKVDELQHVHRFMDMHNVGDIMLKSGLSDPMLQRENLTFTYKTVKQLLLDLKHTGAQNRLKERRKHLTPPSKIQNMYEAYESFKHQDRYPATYEVIYGYAIKKQATEKISYINADFIPTLNK